MPAIIVSDECALNGRRALYLFNFGIPVFLAYTGAMGIAASQDSGIAQMSTTASSQVFQGIYMILFAALLFIYETVQMCPCELLDIVLKRNFGFLYGPVGKGPLGFRALI